MITDYYFRENKGRLFAVVSRNTIGENDSVEIAITNTENTHIHTKYLPKFGGGVSIDITPYCKAYMTGKLSSVLVSPSNIIVSGTQNDLSVSAGITNTSGGSHMFNGYTPRNYGILTKLPYLQVSKSSKGAVDRLFLGVLIPDEGAFTMRTDSEEVDFPTNLADIISFYAFGQETQSVQMSDMLGIYEDADILNSHQKVRTVPRGMYTRRLIWRNELGGIDAWSFEFLREKTFATTSEVFYSTLNGYTRTNRQHERLNIVETREVDERVADALAYITASPDVYLWDYETNKPIPIDIVTEECRTYSDTELTSIQIAYRLKERDTL